MSGIEEITALIETLKIQDEITVCSWNIFGENTSGITKHREKVVTETLKTQKVSGAISLSQSDIMCLQEVPVEGFDYIQKYVPTLTSYNYKMSSSTSSRFSMVLYNLEKFTVNSAYLNEAFDYMETKKKMYDFIAQNDLWKTEAIKGVLQWKEESELEIFHEVLRECRQAKSILGFNDLLDRYKAPNEPGTKSPKVLLERRMAIVALQFKNPLSQDRRRTAASSQEPILVVISIHSYKDKDESRKLIYLLFDFLNKLDNSKVIIILAGDFNLDIYKEQLPEEKLFKEKFLDLYHVPKYGLRSLRKERIDFIAAGKQSSVWEFVEPVITAHDLVVPHEIEKNIVGHTQVQKHRTITNHSPLSTTLQLKRCHVQGGNNEP